MTDSFTRACVYSIEENDTTDLRSETTETFSNWDERNNQILNDMYQIGFNVWQTCSLEGCSCSEDDRQFYHGKVGKYGEPHSVESLKNLPLYHTSGKTTMFPRSKQERKIRKTWKN
jgi:hypothetical protein